MIMSDCFTHQPVLLNECIAGLAIKKDGVYVDGTLGRGGHSTAILDQLGDAGRLIGIDADAILLAEQQQSDMGHLFSDARFSFCHDNFANLTQLLSVQGLVGKVNGILLDLGVSSPQLDDASRGFSFQRNGPLDMRMDTTQGVDAATWLNQVSEAELIRVLRIYGEEPAAKRIARAVIRQRELESITTTRQLSDLVSSVIARGPSGKHAATRTFQAIRIAINDELRVLEKVLPQCVEALAPGGRLCIISFHSLEDRLVKQFIARESAGVVDWLPGMREPEYNQPQTLRKIGKVIRASEEETRVNARARSACLRVAEKQG
jgi:16S rRNA (cytosine1402-N4)-methyltransferase